MPTPKILFHKQRTWVHYRARKLHRSCQCPIETAGRCENEIQTPNKTTGGREGETETDLEQATKRKWENKMPIAELSRICQRKTIVPGIWVNNCVWLSSYRSPSVNVVRPIRQNECLCVGDTQWSVWLGVSTTVFSSLLLPLISVCPVWMPQSMSLFPPELWKRSHGCRKQVWNEKGQITREWRVEGTGEWEKEWKRDWGR